MKTNHLKLPIALLCFILLIVGCNENLELQEEVRVSDASAAEINAEEAYPDIQGEIVTIEGDCSLFCEYESIDDDIVVEGDILLTTKQIDYLSGASNQRIQGAGLLSLSTRWPNNIVYYTINASLPSQSRVTNAIAHWEANSNLEFQQRTSQSNYIEFVVGSGCSSYLGMIGGRQVINLASGCSTGNTIHEIGHAIGLFHEHTREDRDNTVNILWSNITNGAENNFRKYSDLGYSGFDFGGFDIGSIMMYGSFFFSNNGLPTITLTNGNTFSVQRTALSSTDIAISKYMYPGKGQVSTGSSNDLDRYRSLYNTLVASGMDIDDVVGMGIAGSNDYCYVWYSDGTVSSGNSSDLDVYRSRYSYSLAPGKTPSDIVGMGIAGSNDYCYVWYSDGTVSSGNSSNLDAYRSRYSYSLAPGKTPSDIVGMGIAGSNDYCYVWYSDGTVSSGNSSNLDAYRSRYSTSLAPGKTSSDIVGMGIAGSNDYCYVWYK